MISHTTVMGALVARSEIRRSPFISIVSWAEANATLWQEASKSKIADDADVNALLYVKSTPKSLTFGCCRVRFSR